MSTAISENRTQPTRLARIWDIPTRAIHWAIALLIPFLWWTHKTDHMDWHIIAGVAVSALLVFRIFLGFFGAETSRFSSFLRGPRSVWNYLRGSASVRTAGHNPLGGWSVASMLGLLILQTGLGLFASEEDGLEAGPLADFVTFDQTRLASQLHAVLFNGLFVLIGVHIAAILFYQLRGDNLVGPMITGRKRLSEATKSPVFASGWILALGLALAVATFGLLWRLEDF